MKNLLFLTIVLLTSCAQNKSLIKTAANESIVFVGTYTKNMGWVNGKAKGIYTCRMNNTTGELTIINATTDIQNPSFLTISPNKKYLYAVAENGGDALARYGSVVAYKITEGGQLLKLNEKPSFGAAPCHISTDKKGKFVFVSNYSTGTIASYGINKDGSLTDTLCVKRNEGNAPLAHQIFESPDASSVFVVDKGADKIFLYTQSKTGQLTLKNGVSTAAGAGPRHLDFTPNRQFGYVINEVNSTINAYKFNALTNELTEIQTVKTLPENYTGKNTTAEIWVHPNGRFVFGSNRGHNSIAIFRINDNGTLTAIGHELSQGDAPRNFMISPDGKLLLVANQNSDNVVAFSIDTNTGRLIATGKNNQIPTPVCLRIY
ncbi:MAG: lactonase family protein [Saprospiraceae bacterium]|nr:lactonase family protein [Saprospiraceae bacterium]